MTRALAAARLYVLNKWGLIWIPLIVVGTMILFTIILRVVLVAAGADPDAVYFNGAFQAAIWVLFGVAISASTQMFPLAFAMSLTRRDFMAGTLLVTLGVGVGYGFLYGLLAWFEQATGGLWIGAYAFDLMGFVGGSIGSSFVLYAGVIGLFFTAGLAASMLWKRFNGRGLVLVGLAAALVASVLGAIAGLTDSWPRVFAWVVQQTPMSVGGYTAAVAVVLAGASYLMIRHAEP